MKVERKITQENGNKEVQVPWGTPSSEAKEMQPPFGEGVKAEEMSTMSSSPEKNLRRRSTRAAAMKRTIRYDDDDDDNDDFIEGCYYCVLCESEFCKDSSLLESSEGGVSGDEIFFLLEKCLGLPLQDCEKVKGKLLGCSGGDHRRTYFFFCPDHQMTLRGAKELHSKVVQLKKELTKLKKSLRKAVVIMSPSKGGKSRSISSKRKENWKIVRDSVLKCQCEFNCFGRAIQFFSRR
jgi:hypothetical protein